MANRVAQELAERGGIGVRYGCHCAHMLIKRLLKRNVGCHPGQSGHNNQGHHVFAWSRVFRFEGQLSRGI